ncbi:MAG: CerR family C-terminal domain-containing protein [Candidatus Methylomirabilales bacterium]
MANTQDTRARLLRAAGEVFAEVGYQAATVRAICARAGANVAGINYHFGDKLGLYTALLQRAARENEVYLADVARARTPEDALRQFVRGMLRRLTQKDRLAWYAKMMAHELVQPTPALAAAVEHLIAPNAKVLYETVGRILGRPPLEAKTRMCADSIIGQVAHYVHARPVIARLWPEFQLTDRMVEELAGHITDFSLEALRAMKRKANGKPGCGKRSK